MVENKWVTGAKFHPTYRGRKCHPTYNWVCGHTKSGCLLLYSSEVMKYDQNIQNLNNTRLWSIDLAILFDLFGMVKWPELKG